MAKVPQFLPKYVTTGGIDGESASQQAFGWVLNSPSVHPDTAFSILAIYWTLWKAVHTPLPVVQLTISRTILQLVALWKAITPLQLVLDKWQFSFLETQLLALDIIGPKLLNFKLDASTSIDLSPFANRTPNLKVLSLHLDTDLRASLFPSTAIQCWLSRLGISLTRSPVPIGNFLFVISCASCHEHLRGVYCVCFTLETNQGWKPR